MTIDSKLVFITYLHSFDLMSDARPNACPLLAPSTHMHDTDFEQHVRKAFLTSWLTSFWSYTTLSIMSRIIFANLIDETSK